MAHSSSEPDSNADEQVVVEPAGQESPSSIGVEEATSAYWINHFGLHFTAVTLIVYLLLLIVVSIGIWMPAHKLSRISPVDALRDE